MVVMPFDLFCSAWVLSQHLCALEITTVLHITDHMNLPLFPFLEAQVFLLEEGGRGDSGELTDSAL